MQCFTSCLCGIISLSYCESSFSSAMDQGIRLSHLFSSLSPKLLSYFSCYSPSGPSLSSSFSVFHSFPFPLPSLSPLFASVSPPNSPTGSSGGGWFITTAVFFLLLCSLLGQSPQCVSSRAIVHCFPSSSLTRPPGDCYQAFKRQFLLFSCVLSEYCSS